MACFLFLVLLNSSLRINSASMFPAEYSSTQDNSLRSVISRLTCGATRYKSTIIVYEKYYEYSAVAISTVIARDKYVAMYKNLELPTFLRQQLKFLLENATLTEFRDQLNFVVVCAKECIHDAMKHVTEIDNTVGLGTLLRHFSTWLIISPDPPSQLNITLDNVAFMRTDHPLEITLMGTDVPSAVMDYIKYTEVYTLLWMPVGREWSRVYPCDLSHDQIFRSLFPNNLRGLNGRQLIIAIMEWLPYTKRKHLPGEISYVGASIDIIDQLADTFNFSYTFVEPSDNSWGQQIDDESWTGVIGMMQRGEADICIVPYGITLARRRVMDFSTPFLASSHSAMYIRRGDDVNWFYLLSCFSWQVYLCGTGSLLWMALLLALVSKERKGLLLSCKEGGLPRSFENGIRISLRQGILQTPEPISARILVCTLYLFCLVVTAVYTGNLVAVMSVDKHNVPFTTIQELAEQDEYEVATFDESYGMDMLQNSGDTAYKTLYGKLTKLPPTTDAALTASQRRLLNDKFVLIASSAVDEYMKSKMCEIFNMKERLFIMPAGFTYPHNSPMKKLFDNQLLFMKEIGLIDLWYSKWTPKPMKCYTTENVPQMKIIHLVMVVVTCAGSVMLATIVLLMEIWKKKMNSKRQNTF